MKDTIDVILGLIEVLTPVLVFVFWIIIQIAAANKKRNRTISSHKPQEQPQPSSTGDGKVASDGKVSVSESIKKTLEVLFGEMDLQNTKPSPQTDPPVDSSPTDSEYSEEYENNPEMASYNDNDEYQETEPNEKYSKESNVSDLENKKSIENQFTENDNYQVSKTKSIAKTRVQQAPDNAYTSQKRSNFDASLHKKLREAVVFSEILASPVSLREE